MGVPVVAHPLLQTAVPYSQKGLIEFCRKWKVTTLSLYGPILEANLEQVDEVGVVLDFEPDAGHSLYEWAEMKQELEGLFHHQVEMVTPRSVGMRENPSFRKRVLDGARQVYPS